MQSWEGGKDRKTKCSFNILEEITHEWSNNIICIRSYHDPGNSNPEEIGKQLGMRPEEIFRLSDFSKEDFLNMMKKWVKVYSKDEFIKKI